MANKIDSDMDAIRKQFMHAGFTLGFMCTTRAFNNEATDPIPFETVNAMVDAAFERAYEMVLTARSAAAGGKEAGDGSGV